MIHTILKKEVPQYLTDENFWNQKTVPSSPHKLLSLCQNPDAEEDSAVSFYNTNSQNEIDAYLTNVGGKLNNEEGLKINFMSSWWSGSKIKGVGTQLVEKALEDTEGMLCSYLFDPYTLKVYERMNSFHILRQVDIHYISIKFYPKNNWQKIPLQSTKMFNKYQECVNKKIQNSISDISVDPIFQIDSETEKFLQPFYTQNVFKREKKSFDWIRKYPWLLIQPLTAIQKPSSYFFLTHVNYYQLFFLKIYYQGQLKGFLVMNCMNQRLKICYLYHDNIPIDKIGKLIEAYAFTLNANIIITSITELIQAIHKSEYYHGEQISTRYAAFSNTIETSNFKDRKLHLGDGEFLFT